METEEEGEAAERLLSKNDRSLEQQQQQQAAQTDSQMDGEEREDDGVSQYLLERVYFAARDGFPLTLHALLTDQPSHRLHRLLNTVFASFFLTSHFPLP